MSARAAVLALVFVFTAFIAGCKKGPSWKSQTYTDVNVKPQSGEVQIPAAMWEKLLALVEKPAAKPGEKKEEKKSEEEAATPETALEPLKVYLVERNKGVLKGQNIALSFVAGGGELNLSDYTAALRGSYYIAFEFMPTAETPPGDVKVFFLSNSVVRKVGDDKLGSGCNTYFDLTKRFAEAMKHDGFLVNTSDQRDVSALAGTYVFATVIDGKLHMSTLIIKDDDHRRDLQCRH